MKQKWFFCVIIVICVVTLFIFCDANAQYYTWAKQAGGADADSGWAITVQNDNIILLTGPFEMTATFGDPGGYYTTLTSAGYADMFLAKYDPDGNLIWAKRAGGSESDAGKGIALLPDGGILVVGWFWFTATFGQGEENQTSLTSAGSYDIFLARYNPDGSLVWVKRAGGGGEDESDCIVAFPDGSSLIAGDFYINATFGPGESGEVYLTSEGYDDIFIASYNPDGTLVWVKTAGGIYSDTAYGICALSDGSFFITGWFRDTAVFGKGEPAETHLTADGFTDIFIAHYNPDGSLVWAKRAGGVDWDWGYKIAALTDGSSLVVGTFSGSATFGDAGDIQTTLLSNGNEDIFIAKYKTDGRLAWVKQAGGLLADGVGNVAVLPGCFAISGVFTETSNFGAGESNEIQLTSRGGWDIYVARYNTTDGTLVWARQAGDIYWDGGSDIASTPDGDWLITGWFFGTTRFDTGEESYISMNSSGYSDIFLAKVDDEAICSSISWELYY